MSTYVRNWGPETLSKQFSNGFVEIKVIVIESHEVIYINIYHTLLSNQELSDRAVAWQKGMLEGPSHHMDIIVAGDLNFCCLGLRTKAEKALLRSKSL